MNFSDVFHRPAKPAYRVIRGLNFHGKRAEPGDIRRDIPPQSVAWLLERGHIEVVDDQESN